jgi:alpha-beta hydrolase superfamily lysophospholipase
MGEHGARYVPLARRLCERGCVVIAPDLRGHGQTAGDRQGVLGPGGWEALVDDVDSLARDLLADRPGAPCVLLGHSMGSFVAQQLLAEHDLTFSGVALSGSTWTAGPMARVGASLARFESWRQGPSAHSRLLHKLLFGQHNRSFRPARTEFDWLSRDTEQVDAYIADPMCGFVLSNSGIAGMLRALRRFQRPTAVQQIPRDLPVYLFAGDRDPIQGRRGFERLVEAYNRAGLRRLCTRLYPEARHETLNELNRQQVEDDFLAWLESVLEPQIVTTRTGSSRREPHTIATESQHT